jgi:hypothetical protein
MLASLSSSPFIVALNNGTVKVDVPLSYAPRVIALVGFRLE